MATETGEQTPFVIRRLTEKAKDFSFVQAVRLLALSSRPHYGTLPMFLRQGLKVVPELSLGHPSSDLAEVREEQPSAKEHEKQPASAAEHYTIVATFLSLYGVSSPLPTFYTEELIEDARSDETACREFLDIFNQTLYSLYYRAYNSGKIGLRTVEQRDARMLTQQFCMLGLGDETLREDAGATTEDLRYISLFAQHTRSARNLERYLTLRLGFDKKDTVEIEECVARHMPIAEEQCFRLGHPEATLGEGVIGTEIHDYEGTFRIHLHDLDREDMARFQPGAFGRQTLDRAVRLFLHMPLLYDIVLHARANSLSGALLGVSEHGRLGVNAFLTGSVHAAQTVTHSGKTVFSA